MATVLDLGIRVHVTFPRDVDEALTYTSTSIELMPQGTASRIGRTEPYRGHDGLREYFADAERVWTDLRLTATDYRATAGGVVVFGHVEGEANGERIRRQAVWIWQVRSGLAVSMRVTEIGDAKPV